MPQPLEILIVEDNPADAELVVRELRRAGYEPKWLRVETEADFLAHLHDGLDLVLSDYAMPEFSGLRALKLLRERGLKIPFLIVSGTIGEETAVEAMRLGATDYLLKDRLARLGQAVDHALEDGRLRRERRQADEALRIAHTQLSQLLEHSPAVLYVLKLDGDKVVPHFVSEHITTLLGFTVAETSGQEWWLGQLHPDDRERAVNSRTETFKTGVSRSEYRLRHKDGRYCWVDDARRLVRDAAGAPVELIGVWTDITERRRAEEIVEQASGHVARDRRKRVRIELAILVAATAVIYALAADFRWFNAVTQWVLAHRIEQLDETVLTTIFLVAGLVIFAFRRWRESESELTSRQQAQAALGLLHKELDRRVKQRTGELDSANQALRAEITERKHAVETLVVERTLLRTLIDLLPDYIFVKDRQSRFLACNEACARLMGAATPADLIGRTDADFYPAARAAEFRADELKVLAGGTVLNKEEPFTGPDGVRQIILATKVPLRDSRGDIVGLVGTNRDITEREQTELSLRESEERFRQVVENIHEVFWMSDVEKNRIIYISPGYEQIWGRKCEELYADPSSWAESIQPEDRERVLHAAKTKQVSGDYDETYRIVRPDGAARWIRDQAFPVKEADGRVRRIVGVAEDITDRKGLEAQFLHAQRMEAVGTLASGVAHDLNNILAPMLLVAGLLKENAATPRDREMLVMMERSGHRGAAIIRQLLSFSRGLSGERLTVQLKHLLHDMAGIMRETFPRNITILESVPPDLWPIEADPTQMHQVIMNLCVNARDAMPTGGKLTLSARNTLLSEEEARPHANVKAGPYVMVTLTDTGQGIPPEIVPRIFDPFFTTKAVGKGTGLGLSTVAGIVKNHLGFVTVYSQPGWGSVFKVHLPATTSTDGAEADAVDAAGPPGNNETILIVDDEEPIREMVRQVLERNNYRVLLAGNAEEAISLFLKQGGSVRLVLTDIMMPGMDGLELIRKLRTLDPGLRIITCSGLDQDARQADYAALGIRESLNKPFLPSQLLRALSRALAEKQ